MNEPAIQNPPPPPAERLAWAQPAFREFHARCFWFMRPDAAVLETDSYALEWTDTQETLQRATVSKHGRATKVDWALDSAFRFFPVLPDAELGFVLHPLDGAANKPLALAGRGELRDYGPGPGFGLSSASASAAAASFPSFFAFASIRSQTARLAG